MNISTTNQELAFSTISAYNDKLRKKYKKDHEEQEYQLNTLDTTFKLFSALDELFKPFFKFRCDMMMITDDHCPGETAFVISYVNKNSPSGYTFSELPEDSLTIGWIMEKNHIDIHIGGRNCAYIDVKGPTVILPAFNEDEFGNVPMFKIVSSNIWKGVTEITLKMMEPTPHGSTAIDVSDNINNILRKWIDDCEDENLKNLRYAFCAMIECVDDILFDVYECYTSIRYIEPTNKEIEPRYVSLHLMEEDGHYISEGLDLAQVPETMSMFEFSLDRPLIQVTMGTEPIATIWVKEGKARLRFDSVEDDLKTDKYEEMISRIKENFSECFESN